MSLNDVNEAEKRELKVKDANIIEKYFELFTYTTATTTIDAETDNVTYKLNENTSDDLYNNDDDDLKENQQITINQSSKHIETIDTSIQHNSLQLIDINGN